MSEPWTRLRRLGDHWVRLVGGSALMVGVAVFERYAGLTIPWPVYASLLVLLLLYAGFRVLVEEREKSKTAAVHTRTATSPYYIDHRDADALTGPIDLSAIDFEPPPQWDPPKTRK